MIDNRFECEAERLLLENGYEGVVFLVNSSYDSALVGVTNNRRAVYNYELMVEYLVKEEGFEDEYEARDFIDYNTLRALPYFGKAAPIVYYPKDHEKQSILEFLDDHCFEDDPSLIEGIEESFLGVSEAGSALYDISLAEKLLPGVSNDDYSSLAYPPLFVSILSK